MVERTIDIVLLTHNHAHYIEACLTSISKQTVFDQIRVILCEDASTDETTEICLQFAERYPQFELHSHSVNKGFSENMAYGLRQLKAPFFALMDGDDFYLDTEKLEKQLDFLQKNPEFVATAHDVSYINHLGEELASESTHTNGILQPDEWTGYRPYHTNTFLARRITDLDIDRWEPFFLSSDQVIIHLLHHRGKVSVRPERMSAYRKHPQGYSVKVDKVEITQNLIALLKELDAASQRRFHKGYQRSISKYYADLFRFKLRNGRINLSSALLHYFYGLKGGKIDIGRIPWILKQHYVKT